MAQSGTVILDYHKAESQGANSFWSGTVAGREKKFIRVLCGLAVPQLDRQAAAVIVLGELLRNFAPVDFTGLAAAVGSWPEVKNALVQFCRNLSPDHIVVENEQSRKLVWPVTDSLVGVTSVPMLSYAAPPQTLTEIGRANVQTLIDEGRLHIEHLLPVLDQEIDQADKALRCAVNWALEFSAFYAPRKRGQPEYKLCGEF
jgi:hypothetical protein